MTTPNHVSQHRRAEPVPQWCYDAAEEIIGHRATYIAAIIARHAPQAEPPQPAPRYACSKLAAVGDTVKVVGSEPPLIMKVEELSTTGGLYIKSLTGTACMLLNSSQVEFVPEIPPAGEAAVWPRYFRLCEDGNWRWVQYKPDLPLLYKKFDGSMTNADVNIEELMNRNDAIETDAHGNASPNTEAKRATSNPPQDPPRPPKQLPQSDASGVERWDVRSVITLGDEPPYVIEKCRSGQFVKAADHDRVVADLQRKLQIREAEIGIGGSPPPYPTWMQQVESRDATIAELNKDAKEDHAVILAYQRRAEAAEAEVARLHKIVGDCELVAFDNCNPPQLWSWIGDWEGGAAEPLQRIKNAKDAVKEIADLTAQLAAANERIREAYAILCQLENVYRRQSTESVGSFGVSQEVHSLLKRAMDTLNGKEKQ